MKIVRLICVLFLFSICASAQTFDVTAYGATPNDAGDDLAAFQSANTAAAAVKGIVYIPAGVWDLSAAFQPSDNVTIRGAGHKSSILRTMASVGLGGHVIAISGKSDVRIEHLGLMMLDEISAGINISNSTDCLVFDVWVDGNTQWGGMIGGDSQRCGFDYFYSDGTSYSQNIEINASSYCFIRHSYLKNAAANGIELYHNDSTPSIGISDNEISDTTIESPTGIGIGCAGDQRTIIRNNRIFNYGTYGILIVQSAAGASYPSIDGILKGNQLTSSTGVAIASINGSAQNWNISNNSIRGGTDGIQFRGDRFSVVGNLIVGSSGTGLVAFNGGSSITGNVVINCARGIQIEGGRNTIQANVATDTRTPKVQDYGLIFLSGANENVYGGNSLSGNLVSDYTDNGFNNGFGQGGTNLLLSPALATATVTTNNSGFFRIGRSYWNGTTNVTDSFSFRNVAAGTTSGNGWLWMTDRAGTVMLSFADTARGDAVAIGFDGADASLYGQLHVRARADSYVGLTVQKYSSSATADLQQWRNQSSTVLASVDKDGNAAFPGLSLTSYFLPPRLTTTQRDAISSPPEGSIIFNLTTHKLNVYANGAWEAVTSA